MCNDDARNYVREMERDIIVEIAISRSDALKSRDWCYDLFVQIEGMSHGNVRCVCVFYIQRPIMVHDSTSSIWINGLDICYILGSNFLRYSRFRDVKVKKFPIPLGNL